MWLFSRYCGITKAELSEVHATREEHKIAVLLWPDVFSLYC